jgi:hypothetical protein
MIVAQAKPAPPRKPQRHNRVWDKFSAAQIARLKELFSTGEWYGQKVVEAISRETGITIGGGSIPKMFRYLSDLPLGNGNRHNPIDDLPGNGREQVRAFFKTDPMASYKAMAERIKGDFGLKVSEATVRNWWIRQPDLAPAPAPTAVAEISVTVRECDKVIGQSSITLPFRRAGE